MHRRTVLRTAPVALGSALAGCIDEAILADGQSDSEQSTDSGTDTETMTDESSSTEMRVALTIENQADRAQSGTVEVSHILTPACRYESLQCGEPSRENTALDTSFDVETGEQQVFNDIGMQVGADDTTVDSYAVEVRTDSIAGELTGLEAGGASVVGRKKAGTYPWRVTGQEYQIRAILTSDGIEIAVQSVR